MTDIGTGTYTIIAQTAAEMMGVPLERVRCELGDSSFPSRPVRAGSGAPTAPRPGVYAACVKLRESVAGKFGMDATAQTSMAAWSGRRTSARLPSGGGRTVAEDAWNSAIWPRSYQQSTFGGHFVEVAVDSATGEIRIRRMLAVCSAAASSTPSPRAAR